MAGRAVDAQLAADPSAEPLPTAAGRTASPSCARPDASRLSVCLYTPSVDPSGMGAHMVDLAAQYLPGADVSFMCPPSPGGRRLLDQAAALGATAVPLPHPRDPSFAGVIVRFLREHPADVFHIHVGTGEENFDGARAARRAGIPAIVQTLHLPWVVTRSAKRRRFFAGVQRVDHFIAVSEAQRATYERIGVPAERFSTVPNGIGARGAGLGRRAARRTLGLDADQPVVMTIGRLTAMKGQRHLIDSVPALAGRFPGLVVLIVGEGHLRGQLEARIAKLGVARWVRLLGHRPDARMLLDAADVFVLPSLYEGMPLVALEAMEAGVPVVATRVIGTEEIVADEQTGLLVPPHDPAALAQALAAMLADRSLRTRYGDAGRHRYRQHFTSERMAQQTAAVYRRVLQQVATPVTSAG